MKLVTKKNGNSQPYNPEKIFKVLKKAVDGLTGVSAERLFETASQYWTCSVKTISIMDGLTKVAGDLILEDPNYQWVASRLLNFKLRGLIWGGVDPIHLAEQLRRGLKFGCYTKDLKFSYSQEDLDELNSYIDHDRDFLHDYAGMVWLTEKYLTQDRSTRTIIETPQMAYMLFAMTAALPEKSEKRVAIAKEFYDHVSQHIGQLSTPILAGMRTRIKQFASCTLIDVDDTLPSIGASLQAMMLYASQRAGLGLNIGRIRPVHSKVGYGEIVHTGVVPFLKAFESTIKSVSQGGIRSASATTFFPWWHGEVETLLILKNQAKNPTDRQVFKLDYCFQACDLFWERLNTGKNISLLNGSLVPGLYDAFGTPKFRELYEEAERTGLGVIKVISAVDLFELYVREAIETGRDYIMNMDECNRHSPWTQSVRMSNLCVEITQPTIPIQSLHDTEGEIGICMLSAQNWANLDVWDDKALEQSCRRSVRLLDNTIDYQDYPVLAGKKFCTRKRSLAIGITGLATWLARQGLTYDTAKASANRVAEAMERVQFYLLKASMELAIERGPCADFHLTKYAQGILPIDTYRKTIDQYITAPLKCDWEWLRGMIVKHGLRNSTVTAQPPCESSSVVQCSSNGIEAVRKTIFTKKAREGMVWQVMKGHGVLNYSLAFKRASNAGYLLIVAAIQKFMDMTISANLYYDYERFPDGKIPLSVVSKDIIMAEQLGVKSLYYTNTDDGDVQSSKERGGETDQETSGCESGACSL